MPVLHSRSPPSATFPSHLQAGKGDIYGIPRAEWLRLQSPARYLGNEFGACHKPWSQADIRFALTYPEVYEGAHGLGSALLDWPASATALLFPRCGGHADLLTAVCACLPLPLFRVHDRACCGLCAPVLPVGASNLGHIILYGILNQQDGLLCDRAYYPAEDMQVGGLAGGRLRGLAGWGVPVEAPCAQLPPAWFCVCESGRGRAEACRLGHRAPSAALVSHAQPGPRSAPAGAAGQARAAAVWCGEPAAAG